MESIRLTQFSPGAGCGCKISPAELHHILEESRPGNGKVEEYPDLLVGYDSSDDAAVYDIGGGKAVISTTDFFTPIVDDPFDFGRIAATNAISDVYAMGGSPLMAISILGWPLDVLPAAVAGKVVEGARLICSKAGIPLAGGHSINSTEPIFGLAVTGIIEKELIRKNNSVRQGDGLYLTKPLGIGLISTGIKKGLASREHIRTAISLMTRLNAEGPRLALLKDVHAITDVTGFGLLGHCLEMVDGGSFIARIDVNRVPFIPGIETYITQDCIPGGTHRNFASYKNRISFSPEDNTITVGLSNGGHLPHRIRCLLCDPQTSGGLFIAADPAAGEQLEKDFGVVCIGEIH